MKDQDRTAWDKAALAEADAMIVGCLQAAPPGRAFAGAPDGPDL
jgi:hypothetical protein